MLLLINVVIIMSLFRLPIKYFVAKMDFSLTAESI